MKADDPLPPTPPLSTPLEVRLVGLHPEPDNAWTVVLAVRGLEKMEPLAIAAASASVRSRLLDDPPAFFQAVGWDEVGAPVPKKGDEVEVIVLMVGDFDSVLFED